MKYFLDTEFIEGPQEPKWLMLKSRLGHWMIGKPKPTIDLISIGIVAEDGREYYAISKDFNLKEAWNRFQLEQQSGDMRNIFPEGKKVYWLRENVLYPIFWHLYQKSYPAESEEDYGNLGNFMGWKERKGTGMKEFRKLLQEYGKTNKEIAEEVEEFCKPNQTKAFAAGIDGIIGNIDPNIEFYAYYADYDWVVFCWLFGKMMDLPNGFPMYCKDLKQDFDFYNENFKKRKELNAVGNLHKSINELKDFKDYPKQENEHSAIDDARWNKKLFDFLQKL